MTLFPDPNLPTVRRPTPLPHLGATPLRDLVIAEKYGACVDAKGDLWMWGSGYDPNGSIGKSLKGRVSWVVHRYESIQADGKIPEIIDASFWTCQDRWAE